MRFAVEIASAKGGGQDRVRVVELADGMVIALADGAGGTGNGAVAAQLLVDSIAHERVLPDAARCAALIEEIDLDPRLAGGQTTAVILAVSTVIVGASVGDSGAWLIGDDIVDLTSRQQRKPLVGDGCTTHTFELPFAGTLVVASDGLLRYAKPSEVARVARDLDPRALIDLVRLPNGGLQDDVSVVIVC